MSITRSCVAALLLAATLSACKGPAALRAAINIHYSRYEPAHVTVRAGEPVTFVLHNSDPIDHEFIIGTEAQQLEHEGGTQKTHDGLPGQASLAPGETQTITYTFAKPVTLIYACHVSGHCAYGMRGLVEAR